MHCLRFSRGRLGVLLEAKQGQKLLAQLFLSQWTRTRCPIRHSPALLLQFR